MIRLKREAKAKGGFYVEPEAKLMLVIRIRGINHVDPKVGAGGTRLHASGRRLGAHHPEASGLL